VFDREASQRKLEEMELSKQTKAALTIQNKWRQRKARREVGELKNKRKALQRQKQRETSKEKLAEIRRQEEDIAARIVQKNWRSRQERRKFLAGQMQRRHEKEAAEAAEKASKERILLAQQKQASREAAEKKLQEMEERGRHEAATKIQNLRRGQMAKRDVNRRKDTKQAEAELKRLDEQRKKDEENMFLSEEQKRQNELGAIKHKVTLCV
jgi:hypothetical protein